VRNDVYDNDAYDDRFRGNGSSAAGSEGVHGVGIGEKN
jgi:hypothetical protein